MGSTRLPPPCEASRALPRIRLCADAACPPSTAGTRLPLGVATRPRPEQPPGRRAPRCPRGRTAADAPVPAAPFGRPAAPFGRPAAPFGRTTADAPASAAPFGRSAAPFACPTAPRAAPPPGRTTTSATHSTAGLLPAAAPLGLKTSSACRASSREVPALPASALPLLGLPASALPLLGLPTIPRPFLVPPRGHRGCYHRLVVRASPSRRTLSPRLDAVPSLLATRVVAPLLPVLSPPSPVPCLHPRHT
jgi:hypothetical protein